jgi:hypothetical protein
MYVLTETGRRVKMSIRSPACFFTKFTDESQAPSIAPPTVFQKPRLLLLAEAPASPTETADSTSCAGARSMLSADRKDDAADAVLHAASSRRKRVEPEGGDGIL